MFATKPKALSLSLILYATLALVLATGSDAQEYAPAHIHRREHFNHHRLIRKRAPAPPENGPGGVIGGTQTSPTAANTQTVASAASNTPAQSSGSQAPSNTVSATASPSPSANDPLGLNSILSIQTNPAATATSSSAAGALSLVSSSSSSSSSSSASPSSSSSSSAPPLTTSQPPPVVTTSSPATSPRSTAKVTITTEASEASATASAAPSSSAKITRTTLTVLIVIAACVGGTAIIWTIIRKWKFRASSQFEDRMRPIDWQPTTSDDDTGLPIHRRAGSSASSFHSGSGHDGLGAGYGSTSDHGHGRSVSPLPPLPDHDFTAPPVNLAPVGGYADLARGPSPQPHMQEALTRGPSITRPQYDQYGVPLHHQGGYGTQDAYDYNGTTRY